MKLTEMKRLKLLLIVFISLTTLIFAGQAYCDQEPKVFVDVHGTKRLTAEEVQKRFGEDMLSLAKLHMKPEDLRDKQELKQSEPIRNKIKNGINAMGEFSYLNVSMMKFPMDNNAYFTVDVVEKDDLEGHSGFLARPTGTIPDPDHLIALWKEYQERGLAAYLNADARKPSAFTCPAFNCTVGFDAPGLRKYKEIFNSLVPKDKDQLITVLQKDKDPEKRAAAAFLLAHSKDGNELIDTLIPATHDDDMRVRSAAMQVLAGTLHTVKRANFPIGHVVKALDRKDLEERSKALSLLVSLSVQPEYADYLREHAKKEVLEQLQMQQPYVHDQAYLILQQISGKKFGERDYKAWNNWFASIDVPRFYVDVIGTKKFTAEEVKIKYGKELVTITNIMDNPKMFEDSSVILDKKKYQTRDFLRPTEALSKIIENGIKEKYGYSNVLVDMYRYHDSKIVYFTINAFDKDDDSDYKFSSEKTRYYDDVDNTIATWNEYFKQVIDAMLRSNKPLALKSCPNRNCLFNLDEPKLEKYNDIFEKLVSKNKEVLKEMLASDQDASHRKASVFLLGYLKDSNELVKSLIPSLRDPNIDVRDNAAMVLATTILKMDRVDFPVQDSIDALGYANPKDRQNAALLVGVLSTKPQYVQYLKKHAVTQLINTLKLHDQNTHDYSYSALVYISGKYYGDRDYSAWENWANSL